MKNEFSINVEGCPVASLNPEAFGPSCGAERTHTIMIAGSGPVDVCWACAKRSDAGQTLTLYTEEPAAAASNG
jgi:hypothetical protein